MRHERINPGSEDAEKRSRVELETRLADTWERLVELLAPYHDEAKFQELLALIDTDGIDAFYAALGTGSDEMAAFIADVRAWKPPHPSENSRWLPSSDLNTEDPGDSARSTPPLPS